MTTGFLVRSLLGNSHLEGSENWNIKLKYVLRIMVCKVKYFHVYWGMLMLLILYLLLPELTSLYQRVLHCEKDFDNVLWEEEDIILSKFWYFINNLVYRYHKKFCLHSSANIFILTKNKVYLYHLKRLV